jgi:hypothetical protein
MGKIRRKKVIAVIGGHYVSKKVEGLAYNLGEKLTLVGDILVCGGLSGVMNSVCKGFKKDNNLTVGIIPTYDKTDANEFHELKPLSSIYNRRTCQSYLKLKQ